MSSTTKDTEPVKVGSVSAWVEYLVDPNSTTVFALCSRRQGQAKGSMSIASLTEAYNVLRSGYTGLDSQFKPNKYRAEICARGKITDDEQGKLISPRELARVFVGLVNEAIARNEARWSTSVDVMVG